ncbi:MAG TPA: OB-fold nucleic acid binding domain-containing protein, partial [Candidatus Eisenbacteria bacterium]|nr:OB-fold nucleic acid binding domain-containing protein [Candidatus Eisenbacteria bacterium]
AHPLTPYRPYIEARGTTEISRLREARDLAEVSLVCLVAARKAHTDRNGRPMAFVTLEDLKGTVETTVFADLFEKHRADLEPGAVLEVRGRVNLREDAEPKMVITAVKPLGPPPSGAAVHIDLAGGGDKVSLEEIRSLLVRHPGISPVYFMVRGETDPAPTQIRAKRLLVAPSEELLGALRERLGPEAVRIVERAEEVPVTPMSGAA